MPHLELATSRRALPAAVACAAAGGFVGLAASVVGHGGATQVDAPVAADVLAARSGFLTDTAHVLTLLGSEAVVGVAALLLVVAVLERRGPRSATIAVVAMATSAALTVGVKLAFGRPRPGATDRLGPPDGTYSFPSGHTLNSAVLLGLVCLLLVPTMARRSHRRLVIAASVVLAAGIGASRVYLGYHWTTDVVASWTIAAMILSVAFAARRTVEAS